MKNEIRIEKQQRAVIYCRVSTKEQVDEGNSLVSQERLCREYALKEGYKIAEIYIEKGESAKTAERTELKKMLAFCEVKSNAVGTVITYKVDRISRNIADYSAIKVRLKKANILIKSVTEFFEDTPAGRFMESIIANVSQFDNEVRTERSVGGMKEAMQEGRYVWKASVGYDNTKIDNKATIQPNTYAPLIREAFELVNQGLYSTEIVRHIMHGKGLCVKNGHAVGRSYFYRMLRNPVYKGTIKKFGITTKGTFTPIVSEHLFDEVQNVLKGRKNKTKQYLKENPDFPLRRFIANTDGRSLTGYWAKGKRMKYPYYSFSQPGTTIRKEVLESSFMDLLNQYAFETKHLKSLKDRLIKHFESQVENDGLTNDAIEERIKGINKQIDVLIDLHGRAGISENIFAVRISRLETELEELQELLKAKNKDDVSIEDLLETVASFLVDPHLYWEKSPVEIRRKIQVFVFPKGLVFDGQTFRTPKVCSIYKLKDRIGTGLCPKADLRGGTKNTLSGTNLPPSDEELINSKAFWETVLAELKEIPDILNPEEEEKPAPIWGEHYWWMAS